MMRADRMGLAFLAGTALYLGAHLTWYAARTDLPTGSRTARAMAEQAFERR